MKKEKMKRKKKNIFDSFNLGAYLFETFSSLKNFFATINTTNAIITKFITAPRNAPQLITIAPIVNVAVCHAPPGMNGVIIGIIM